MVGSDSAFISPVIESLSSYSSISVQNSHDVPGHKAAYTFIIETSGGESFLEGASVFVLFPLCYVLNVRDLVVFDSEESELSFEIDR